MHDYRAVAAEHQRVANLAVLLPPPVKPLRKLRQGQVEAEVDFGGGGGLLRRGRFPAPQAVPVRGDQHRGQGVGLHLGLVAVEHLPARCAERQLQGQARGHAEVELLRKEQPAVVGNGELHGDHRGRSLAGQPPGQVAEAPAVQGAGGLAAGEHR